jgi:ATP-dependent RNA helicase HelY
MLGQALTETDRIWATLNDLESRFGLEGTGEPDRGIVGPIHRWALGRSLAGTLRGTELAAGDFVRWCKQVLDVLDQLAKAVPSRALGQTARKARTALLRGVVAH